MTDKTASVWQARVPNVLTIGRIIMIPVLIAGILGLAKNEASWIARPSTVLSLFILAAFTDFLDGFLARRWNVTSDFGRMIDPIADKLLVAGCLIALAIAFGGKGLILAPALAIVGRDILVSGAREHAALQSRAMPPTKLAKWKTAGEMLAIAILIFTLCLPSAAQSNAWIAGIAVLWVAAILSVYTGSLYLRAALKG